MVENEYTESALEVLSNRKQKIGRRSSAREVGEFCFKYTRDEWQAKHELPESVTMAAAEEVNARFLKFMVLEFVGLGVILGCRVL